MTEPADTYVNPAIACEYAVAWLQGNHERQAAFLGDTGDDRAYMIAAAIGALTDLAREAGKAHGLTATEVLQRLGAGYLQPDRGDQ